MLQQHSKEWRRIIGRGKIIEVNKNTMKQITLILLLLTFVLVAVGCSNANDKVIVPSQEEIKILEQIQEHSEKTIIEPVEIDLSDPLITKCKGELDKCKQSLLDRGDDLTFEILKMEKFVPAQNDYGVQESYLLADEFYNTHKGLSQVSMDSNLQNSNIEYKGPLDMYNIFPLILAAGKRFVRPEVWKEMGKIGSTNELPIVLICYKDGTLLGKSKGDLGC